MSGPSRAKPIELWGGIECTVNRVNDRYLDQIKQSGHFERSDDIARFADLGIKTLRYPALWEYASTSIPTEFDWSWADARLWRLQAAGIRPIIGLLHHGSGPSFTNLLDPNFSAGLAHYAQQFASRFPEVEAYTPVNEPLTTARFSGLYGHWFPHHRDPKSFLRMFFNQCRAIVLAMRAIRSVRSDARLIQTEDLGKTHATPTLQYQADFENERRWLTFDILCGRVDRSHPLASYFQFVGVEDREWKWFLDNPSPPNVLGLDHYLASERFLDERLDQYPISTHGGNGRHPYADTEAVRASPTLAGHEPLLMECWNRFKLPIAITELHVACTREEQMRWFMEGWGAAHRARQAGADVRGVTAWAMLGAFDWDSLVTQENGHYEPGVFDLRASAPRATAMSHLIKSLTEAQEFHHPTLAGVGWWKRPVRFLKKNKSQNLRMQASTDQRPILIVGQRGGPLRSAFVRLCGLRGLTQRVISPSLEDVPARIRSELIYQPWAVIYASEPSGIDAAESYPQRHLRSVELAGAIGRTCAEASIPLLTFSSDLVFDGAHRVPYCESDHPKPLSIFGRCKAEAEDRILSEHPRALIIRCGALFGPWDRKNFIAITRRTLRSSGRTVAPDDCYFSPTYLPDMVHASLDLLIDGEHGIWHLANRGEATWAQLARELARRDGHDENAVEGRPLSSFGWRAPRPTYSVLGSERGAILSSIDRAMGRYFDESIAI